MKILSLECSAKSASCAITENGKVKGSDFTIAGLTHSQTLLPMVSALLSKTKTSIKDIDAFAVSAGPGSFTGVRIGISALKGMALPYNTPCIPVSTLSAIAENFRSENALICAVMDARCNQVYSALFRVKNGKITRLCPDRAIKSEELAQELMKSRVRCPIIIAGDGAEVFFPYIANKKNAVLAEASMRYQNGVGVAIAAEESYKKGEFKDAIQILPIYLRLPQAERELKEKLRREKQ